MLPERGGGQLLRRGDVERVGVGGLVGVVAAGAEQFRTGDEPGRVGHVTGDGGGDGGNHRLAVVAGADAALTVPRLTVGDGPHAGVGGEVGGGEEPCVASCRGRLSGGAWCDALHAAVSSTIW